MLTNKAVFSQIPKNNVI